MQGGFKKFLEMGLPALPSYFMILMDFIKWEYMELPGAANSKMFVDYKWWFRVLWIGMSSVQVHA